MKEELIVPKCYYPWPMVNSPITTAFDGEEIVWYDNDYTFISEEGIRRCKKQQLSQVASYMNPTCDNVDHMRPCVRMMIYITLFDDFFALTPIKELKPIANRVYEVMLGDTPLPGELGILRQMDQARKEWIANGMPQFWIERISINFYEFIVYGLMQETPFILAEKRTYPLLAHYLNFRQYSIGMEPYGDLIDPSVNFALPVDIYNHPIIQRCKKLLALIMVIQNDFASLKKELEIEAELLNIIFILHHQYQLSYQEACTEAMRIHDEYVKELDDLHASLPDFSPYQKEAYNYVYHMKLQITGCANWYYNSGTNRYETKGFIVPKYGREGDDIITPHRSFVK